MRRFTLVLVLALTCAGPPALADSGVSGTLWLSEKNRALARDPDGGLEQPDVTEGVVWIETIPDKLEQRLAAPSRSWFRPWRTVVEPPLRTVSQERDAYDPRVLVVPAGERVEFANSDGLYHSTFSVSGARRFDLGKTPPGHRDTLDFPRAGVVNVHCEIHPKAVGYLVVTPNRAYATPDARGRFRLPSLPAGRYVLHAWHPRHGELRLPFSVPRRGSVRLDPTF